MLVIHNVLLHIYVIICKCLLCQHKLYLIIPAQGGQIDYTRVVTGTQSLPTTIIRYICNNNCNMGGLCDNKHHYEIWDSKS